jgi:transcriptional regulator with XRE-family HTH domain
LQAFTVTVIHDTPPGGIDCLYPSTEKSISHLPSAEKNVILPPMPYDHQICVKRIRELMAEARLDMKNLSKKANLGETTVRDLLVRSDKGNPRVQTVFRIAEALGIYPGYLLGLTTTPHIPSETAVECMGLVEQMPEEHRTETVQILRIKARTPAPPPPPPAPATAFVSSDYYASSAGHTPHEPTRTLKK